MSVKDLSDLLEKTLLQERNRYNFLTVEEILSLSKRNVVFDPMSLLISKDVSVGEANVYYHGIIVTSLMQSHFHKENER